MTVQQADSAAPVPPPPPGSSGATDVVTTGTFELGHPEAHPKGRRLAVLSLTALGIVYGDIGTSPLYAFKEAFLPEYHLVPDHVTVYGILSLIVWSLIMVVSVKYIAFVMRADNRGEGGIFALLALLLSQPLEGERGRRRRGLLIGIGLIGAALLYGDGVITPAISVLGAIEGLEVATPLFKQYVVWITLGILFVLFMFQRHGTDRVGKVFGPVMLAWFVVIGGLGVAEIWRGPMILAAVNPYYGVRFFVEHGTGGLIVLGAVVLAVTGAEALYADMGHFGRHPIRLAWLGLVLPCLLLNYFGQGALVLRDPGAATANPFYQLAPRPMLFPLIALATLAAVVASQALISGAFSLTQQAVQLGYSPRMTIIHTSKLASGQIFVPEVNTALMLGCLLVVVGFQSTSSLSAAYGIAVTGTMAITTALFYVVTRRRFGWAMGRALALAAVFFAIDFSFLGANLVKVAHGGWVPLAIAVVLFTLMTTWKRGRIDLAKRLEEQALPLKLFLDDVGRRKPVRVSGTAVFMTSSADGVPVVLLHHLKHNKVLHDQVVILSVGVADVPEVPRAEKVQVQPLEHGFYRVRATFGFMESPNVVDILRLTGKQGIDAKANETTYYLGHERLIPTGPSKMWNWRKHVFIFMARNARSATEFFGIPPNRVVELGTQIEF